MSDEKIPAFREFCNDIYSKIIESSDLLDADEIFLNGDRFNYSIRPTDYDPATNTYATRTYVPQDDPYAVHRYVIDFDISSILQEELIKQFLPEYTEYFYDINRYSTVTATELNQLKDLLVKRSSFTNQFKGTKTAIEFVLSIFANAMGNYLISADPDPYHNFIYRVSTDLDRSLWLKDVKPVIHPNGWGDKYILIVPDHPDYVQLRGEAEIAADITSKPPCYAYLDAATDWKRLIQPDGLAKVDDYHTHYRFPFTIGWYHETLNYIDSVRVELMRPGSFNVEIDRTGLGTTFNLEYQNGGVALEYIWDVYSHGVLVKTDHTFGPSWSFSVSDDTPYSVELTLVRGSWRMTVGPVILGALGKSGMSTPRPAADSFATLQVEETRNTPFEMVSVDNGDDHHRLPFKDAMYEGTVSSDWMNELMNVYYDLDLAEETTWKINRVYFEGPELADRYEWTVSKNNSLLMVKDTTGPELIINTLENETNPAWTGYTSGWEVHLTIWYGNQSKHVGFVTFGILPDIVPPASFIFSGKPTALTNSTTATFTPGENDDTFEYKWKLDNGVWSAPIERVGGVFPVLTFAGLSEGSHTLYYQASDEAGNWSETWSYTWTIDITAPVVTLVTDFGDYANHTTATIDVNGAVDAVDYDYRVDGGAWSARRSFALDIVINSITEGSHTVDVRGYDAAGNTATVSKTWTVDRTAPVVDVTSGFPAVSPTNQQDYTFTVGGGGATQYQYKFDSDPWSGWIDVATPIVLTNLYDGTHTLLLKGKDAAGNEQGTATTRTWVMESSRLESDRVITNTSNNSEMLISGDFFVQALQNGAGIMFTDKNDVTAPVQYKGLTPSLYFNMTNGYRYDADGNHLYVLGYGQNYFATIKELHLHKLDGSNLNTVLSTLTLPYPATGTGLAVSSLNAVFINGNFIYVFATSDTVYKINKTTFTIDSTITLASPINQTHLYACNVGNIMYTVRQGAQQQINRWDLDTGAFLGTTGSYGRNISHMTYDAANGKIVTNTSIIDPSTMVGVYIVPNVRYVVLVPTYYFAVTSEAFTTPLFIEKRLQTGPQTLVQTITINTQNAISSGVYDPSTNRFWTINQTQHLLVINS